MSPLGLYESLPQHKRLKMACEVIKGRLEKDDEGQFIIYTGLKEDENGEIVEIQKGTQK